MQHLIDEAPIAVVVVDANAHIIRVNKAACLFFGYSERVLVGTLVSRLTHPDDLPGTVKVVADLWMSNIPVQRYEKRYIHKSGRTVWGEVSVRIVPDAAGSPAFAIAHILDITDRKRAELELKKSETRYRQLHESMMDAFVSVTMDGCIQDFNTAYQKMLGYDRDELLSRTYVDLTPAKWHAREAAIVRSQIMPRGYSDIYEKEYRRKDKSVFPVEMRTFLLRDDAGRPKGMWAIVRDLTARKSMEENLRRANADLEEKVRDRTIGLRKLAGELTQAEHKERRRIAYVLHEDIQQRLVALQYQVESLISGDGKDAVPDIARRMLGELKHIVQLTRSLSSDLCPPVLYELGLKSALGWLANDMHKKFGLQVHVCCLVPRSVFSDDQRSFAFDAIRELLLNVVKHAGVKRASVQVKPGSQGHVVITVKDKGTGCQAMKNHSAQGSLGLFSIQERVGAFGGSFKVTSSPGKGTVCSFTLPVARD